MSAEAVLQPFVNRLRKNARHWDKWARRLGIECYRLYDRDVPEFPIVVDRYGHFVHVQELATVYAADAIDRSIWRSTLRDLVADATGVLATDVVVKARHGQRPEAQYGRSAEEGRDITVTEAGLRFVVNLERYLDTGLFIDHRETRQLIRERASGLRVLNLFCYTGSFSVYAAAGGALSSVSVDMSRTYLDWARRNFMLNGVDLTRHQLVQADVLQYLRETRPVFDLVVLDPPSFSNSKRMEGVLDLQRHHVDLIDRCVNLLSPQGALMFSTNLRDFRLDAPLLSRWKIAELNRIPADFRNRRIHRSWWLSP